MAGLHAVPDLSGFDDGDGGGGYDDMQELANLACRLVDATIARFDWDLCRTAAQVVTRDDTDADLVVGLMKLAAANIEVSLVLPTG